MTSAMRGMLFGLAITCASSSGPNAGYLCMSDAELHTYLRAAFSRGLGAGLGTCIRKFPSQAQRGLELFRVLEEKHGAEMKAYPTDYRRAFDRAFGARARQVEDQYLWASSGRQEYENFGPKQCNSYLKGLEVLSRQPTLEFAIRATAALGREEARRSIPRC